LHGPALGQTPHRLFSLLSKRKTKKQTNQQDKVSSRSRDGRRLRRSVLKGSVVAFITAGYSGKRFVFETAHELGVKAIVLDAGDRFVVIV
jgi:hypothetical protein